MKKIGKIKYIIIFLISLIFFILIIIMCRFLYFKYYNLIDYNYLKLSEDYYHEKDFLNTNISITCDNKKIKLKKPILIKNNALFIELNDLSNNLDIRFYCKKSDNIYVVLQRYDKEIVYYMNEDIASILMPGANTYLLVSESSFIVKGNLIYIPIYDTLEFFHYDLVYDDNIIQIHDYGNRKDLSWNDIYINAINDYINLSISRQELYKSYLGIPSKYSNKDKSYHPLDSKGGGNYFFSLHDFDNDNIPELLLEESDIDIENYPGNHGMLLYKFNKKNKLLELIEENCVGYDDDNILYKDTSDIHRIVTYEYYKWDNKKRFVETAGDIKNKKEFKTYGGTNLISKKIDEIDVKKIINSYPNLPESIYIDDVKVKVDDKDVIFTKIPPIIKNYTVYLPVKDVFEEMGYKVVWLNNGSPGMLEVGKSNAGILITKGEELYFLPSEGKIVNINRKLDVIDDYNPITIEETFMIPYYWIEKLTGAEVIWENPSIGKLNTVYINLK